ncbi:MAG: tRNA 2-thiouridine(34) synthase MnmA, partial [Candidatus Eremiobacteraeota bacterium]|nr:tRNA 2-thiouridine(34) synthase MnmA [Candidatus Eremiobacteraeota bacterium]
TSQGPIIDSAGQPVGHHKGITNFTIGQRQGLPASGEGPRYVTRIDAQTNTIVVGREDELLADRLLAGELNLIRPERFCAERTAVLAMVRYRANLVAASATILSPACLQLEFQNPQRAVSPGQLVALFDPCGQEVLGAATITSTM